MRPEQARAGPTKIHVRFSDEAFRRHRASGDVIHGCAAVPNVTNPGPATRQMLAAMRQLSRRKRGLPEAIRAFIGLSQSTREPFYLNAIVVS